MLHNSLRVKAERADYCMIRHHLPSLLLSRAWLSTKCSILINILGD